MLRHGRVRSDDFTVELDCGDGIEIHFAPTKYLKGRLDLPFRYRCPAGEIAGVVYLKSPKTPLAIRLERRDSGASLAEAWCLVLEAAAARYCGQPEHPDDERSGPAGFAADARTRETLTHWVSAHRARLPEGQRASDDAVKAAEEVGIDLPDGYTWRRGHLRGRAVELERTLRFTWRPPQHGDSSH